MLLGHTPAITWSAVSTWSPVCQMKQTELVLFLCWLQRSRNVSSDINPDCTSSLVLLDVPTFYLQNSFILKCCGILYPVLEVVKWDLVSVWTGAWYGAQWQELGWEHSHRQSLQSIVWCSICILFNPFGGCTVQCPSQNETKSATGIDR